MKNVSNTLFWKLKKCCWRKRPNISKEKNARSFEIRRALEERREQRKFDEDVDYLDYDLDHDLNNDLDE